MLVVTRRLGERILVPDCELAVTVVAIEGKTVRLGFSAPAEVGVYREQGRLDGQWVDVVVMERLL